MAAHQATGCPGEKAMSQQGRDERADARARDERSGRVRRRPLRLRRRGDVLEPPRDSFVTVTMLSGAGAREDAATVGVVRFSTDNFTKSDNILPPVHLNGCKGAGETHLADTIELTGPWRRFASVRRDAIVPKGLGGINVTNTTSRSARQRSKRLSGNARDRCHKPRRPRLLRRTAAAVLRLVESCNHHNRQQPIQRAQRSS